jgi:ferredoxin
MSAGEHPARPTVDRGACMGSGNCVFWAPAVFDMDDDGIAVVAGDMAGSEQQVQRAAQECPTSAIRIVEEDPS